MPSGHEQRQHHPGLSAHQRADGHEQGGDRRHQDGGLHQIEHVAWSFVKLECRRCGRGRGVQSAGVSKTHARRDRVTLQERGSRQPLAARALQLDRRSAAVAAGDRDASLADGEHLAGTALAGASHGAPDFQRLAGEHARGAGERIEGAQTALDRPRHSGASRSRLRSSRSCGRRWRPRPAACTGFRPPQAASSSASTISRPPKAASRSCSVAVLSSGRDGHSARRAACRRCPGPRPSA